MIPGRVKKQKLIAIVGQTATGKSGLTVRLARKFRGEVVSADSRQVYKGLDLGTGKVPRDPKNFRLRRGFGGQAKLKTKNYLHKGIPHYMLDVADPRFPYSVADFQKAANESVRAIAQKGKVPILCGGTGFYVQSVTDGAVLPEVKPNAKLRKELSKKEIKELYEILKKFDPRRAQTIDKKNPRRLVRAIEIATALGTVPKLTKVRGKYDVLLIGLMLPPAELKKKIRIRLFARLRGTRGQARIRGGMIAEARRLHQQGLSWKRMEELGLEYRYLAKYLKGEMTKEQMAEKLETEIWRYAKRQMTWFKRDKRIKWFRPGEYRKIEKEAEKFIKR
ncbi:MAG: tRNA (adenosine(37)-N6)-dimethylallyltransferase MiaA [bacterium]|nr:tRNA (adenosine(37)-N6)-dimethylallyltransferase MiaA [bacterium]